jgi:hypothetical protein
MENDKNIIGSKLEEIREILDIEQTNSSNASSIDYAWYVGCTGHDDEGVWRDFSDDYITKGIWKNGYTDKFIEDVKSIKVGDRIAIKAKYNQKNNLPFNNYGKKVGAMRIKAIGVVTENPGDGRNLKVNWEKLDPCKVWYGPGTLWATIYLVKSNDGFIKKSLLEFTFGNVKQDFSICEDYYKDSPVDETIEEEKEEYSIDELANILKEMGTQYEQVLSIHLFGIRYGQYIREKKYSIKDIISKAGLPESYFAELNKGIKLSSYVEEVVGKDDIDTYYEEDKTDFDTCPRLHTGTNVILYGVPGAGKSWTIKNEYCDDENRMERLVFHPDYTYSDFVGQILPHIEEDGSVSYEFTAGPFTNLVKKAYHNPLQEYYLIIEEVNRGNAPAIFGDIFQLLDRDVREKIISKDGSVIDNIKYRGSEYEITNNDIAKVVYEDENHKVTIPSNMHILCTMNTSDQNVFTLDTAFQRRWSMRLIKNKFREESSEKDFANTKILDTSVTWDTFFTEINKIILSKNIRMTSSEDKRLGTHFVSEEDLKYVEGDDRQNSRFPEKVLKYLWDDAFKFTKEDIFDLTKVKSLEDVIDIFTTSKKDDRFKVFKENIYKTFVKQDTNE